MQPFHIAVLSAALLALAPSQAQAQVQAYPSKTIKLVVPFGPGGPTDLAARTVAQVVQSGLGQNV
jgi:tripartite-type tricarboxylate transporter receptor subunit TctC